ncbi:E3 ubiquitin-protein ligase TRIM21-like [Neolamprologus brichardi]|uniref:E3 ubiquitin-protein ligase TRIM21-like n=1 Tax=Neolamprologus brichardi TaxID=32507 RepID=UPI001643E6B6|nr:E3 ubiquitin-protein ligase TRIM21-like [Neolamprologus brichardi]
MRAEGRSGTSLTCWCRWYLLYMRLGVQVEVWVELNSSHRKCVQSTQTLMRFQFAASVQLIGDGFVCVCNQILIGFLREFPPSFANVYLVLSDDEKQVHDTNVENNRPYNSQRFFYSAAVLGKQSFSTGRFYFEVQVEGKSEWTLGVARESINMREDTTPRPADGFWTVGLSKGNKYKAGPDVALSLQSAPQKVGVFVDYEDGLVSFYDVDTAAHIYSFTGCSFTEKLYPYFSPGLENDGWNSAPLIITPVD